MHVKDRLNASQSMMGGALYLKKLFDRLPKHIPPTERKWFMLGAYNMGYLHMRDARHLSLDLGKNPNAWAAMESVLPLMSKRKYFKNLRYGYSRGFEALRYVKRIKAYEAILQQMWKI